MKLVMNHDMEYSQFQFSDFCMICNYKVKLAGKPGSVVDSHSSRRFVTLRSSNLPANDASNVIVCLFGLAPDGVYPAADVATSAVSSYLAISTLPIFAEISCENLGGVFSVALSIASRRPAVSRHPALRSPDFPPRPCGRGDCLASFGVESTI